MAKKYLTNAGYVKIIGDFLVLKYAENDGAFLSMFSGFPDMFKVIFLRILPIIALTAMFFYILLSNKMSKLHMLGYTCVIGGGLSNIVDRLMFNGFVVDFMNLGIGELRTGIFNFADLSVLSGIILLFFAYNKKETPVN
jgi:signal peptidase II